MIIEALMNVVYILFDLLTMPISIPGLPEGVRGVMTGALEYISVGVAFLANYCDIGYLVTLFGLIAGIKYCLGLFTFEEFSLES